MLAHDKIPAIGNHFKYVLTPTDGIMLWKFAVIFGLLIGTCQAQEKQAAEYHVVIFTGSQCNACTMLKAETKKPEYLDFQKAEIRKTWFIDVRSPKGKELRNGYKMTNLIPNTAVVEIENNKSTILKRIVGYHPVKKFVQIIKDVKKDRVNEQANK